MTGHRLVNSLGGSELRNDCGAVAGSYELTECWVLPESSEVALLMQRYDSEVHRPIALRDGSVQQRDRFASPPRECGEMRSPI